MISKGYNFFIKRSEPVSLIHFLTHQCNARCTHCFIDFDNPEAFKHALTLEEIGLLTRSVGKNLSNVNLTGGETFLRKDVFEIISLYLTNTSVDTINITTNGYFVDRIRRLIEKYIQLKNLAKLIISVSIDNFEEEHDKNRKINGLYKKALESYRMINSFESHGVFASVSLTVTPSNYKNIVNIYNHLKSEGVLEISAILMREEGVIKHITNKDNVVRAYRTLTARIEEDQRFRLKRSQHNYFLKNFILSRKLVVHDVLADTASHNKYHAPCHSGSLMGVITANGDVYPCEILPDQLMGNLRDYNMHFMKLWQSHDSQNCRQTIKSTKCRCTFECAWSINAISNLRYIPKIAFNMGKNTLCQKM